MNDDLILILDQLRQRGLPVTPATRTALERGVAKYTDRVGADIVQQVLDKLLAGIKSIAMPQTGIRMTETGEQPVTLGETQTSLRAGITQLLAEFESPEKLAESLNLDFKIGTAVDVLQGAGRFVAGQADVDEYPAWELYRLYPRKVPRLWRGDEGTEDKSLGSEFASRWYAAAQTSGDVDAARILQQTGRMIALKSSGIWQALAEFPDGLGNPYPPFAFNSGMEVDGVPRNECIELGLLKPDQQPAPSNFDWSKLISLPEAA